MIIFQLGYVNDLLHDLPLTSESDSSGEESGGEEDKKENTVDEDDQAEAAKLPEYVKKFQVGLCLYLKLKFASNVIIGACW